MIIRLARIDELDQIRQLNSKIFADNEKFDADIILDFALTETGKEYFVSAVTNVEGCFFVAEENRELIGYASGEPKAIPYRKSKYFEIDNLGVLPDKKRSGIGSKLLEAATQWAKDNGYQKIYIESYFNNAEAVAFYKKHGYQEIDISLEKTL